MPRLVDSSLIEAVCPKPEVVRDVQAIVGRSVPVIAEPHMFFEPTRAIRIRPRFRSSVATCSSLECRHSP